MKSIKEKAEESSLGYDEVQAPAIGRGFVLGANYVLDEIEEIINHPRRFVNGDKTIEEGMIEEIEKLLERLKK